MEKFNFVGYSVLSNDGRNIPVVESSNAIALESLKGLKDPKPYLFSFRQRHGMFAPIPRIVFDFRLPIPTDTFTERPQMIWVGFRHGATTDQKFNHALYINEDAETMYVRMNNEQFPPTLIGVKMTMVSSMKCKVKSVRIIYNIQQRIPRETCSL